MPPVGRPRGICAAHPRLQTQARQRIRAQTRISRQRQVDAAINGTGNTLANLITGNAGNNVLNGGTGNDTLVGGLGDDSYVTDGGDVISEGLNAGTDLVQSSVSHILAANLENLTLTGTAATGAAIRIQGDSAHYTPSTDTITMPYRERFFATTTASAGSVACLFKQQPNLSS